MGERNTSQASPKATQAYSGSRKKTPFGLAQTHAAPVVPVPVKRYTRAVIRSFRSRASEDLFHDRNVPRYRAIERVARRKLLLLHSARSLSDLSAPPGNRLERLKGKRRGQHSIRVNDQWRICFVWRDADAFDVEIVDYHGEK